MIIAYLVCCMVAAYALWLQLRTRWFRSKHSSSKRARANANYWESRKQGTHLIELSRTVDEAVLMLTLTSLKTSVDFLGVRTLDTASFKAACTAVFTLST